MTRVLLTNDDGINAPGLLALEDAFSEIDSVDCWTVAPNGERSACSHGMSLDKPITVKKMGHNRFATSGLVADCIYLALYHLLPNPPDIVISGINSGANLGNDVIYSGTVAGAREAVVRGVHGIAASLVNGEDFEAVAQSVVKIALELSDQNHTSPVLLNMNYPSGDFQGPRIAPLGKRLYPKIVHERQTPMSGKNYYWLGGPPVKDARIEGTDGALIHQGIATVTPLLLDQTDTDALTNTSVSLLVDQNQ